MRLEEEKAGGGRRGCRGEGLGPEPFNLARQIRTFDARAVCRWTTTTYNDPHTSAQNPNRLDSNDPQINDCYVQGPSGLLIALGPRPGPPDRPASIQEGMLLRRLAC